MPAEFERGAVVEARMRSHDIVMAAQISMSPRASVRLRNHSMLMNSSLNLPLKLSLSAFWQGLPGSISAVSIFASASHLQERLADELRTVIGADEHRYTVSADQPGKYVDDASRADIACHIDRQALARELVEDSQT